MRAGDARRRRRARRRPGRSARRRAPARRSRDGRRRAAGARSSCRRPRLRRRRRRGPVASRPRARASAARPRARRPTRAASAPAASCSAAGAPTSRPASASSSASLLDLEQLPGREPRRPTRHLARLEQLDAREPRELLRLRRAPARPARRRGASAATARTSSGIVNVGCFSVSPSGASSRTASSSGSTARSAGRGRSCDEPAQLAPAEAVLGRPRQPLLAQPRQVDLLLRLAGRERRHAGGGEALRAERLHVLEQRPPPGRERPDRLLRHLRELGHPFHRLGPLEPEPPRQLVPQLGLVQVAGREPVGAQDRLAVERPPLAVVGAGHVGDDHVRVQVRVLRPATCGAGTPPPRTPRRARAPRRRGRGAPRRPPARDTPSAACHADSCASLTSRRTRSSSVSACSRLTLFGHENTRSYPDTGASRFCSSRHSPLSTSSARTVIVRSRTGARNVAPLAGSTPRSSVPRSPSSTTPTSPSPDSTAPGPQPRRLATTRVVVVQPASDLLLVVGLLPERQLRHAQHAGPTPKSERAETQMHPQVREVRAFTAGATPADHSLTTREPAESCSGPNSLFARRRRTACK